MANSKIACKIKILELMEDLDKLNDDEFEKTSRIITKLAIII